MSDEVENGGGSPKQESTNSETEQEVTQEVVSSESTSAPGAEAVNPDPEPLPDWEELTPEYFEDECRRGDFMLRWAVILLAVLFGWNYLTESAVLLQVKAGQYMLENGFLPPRLDPFAIPTVETTWVNLGWLSDLALGVVYGMGGFTALTVVTAIKLGIAFWVLSRIAIPGVTTWWSSVCAAIALIAVFPVMQPGAMATTVLGLSIVLSLLSGSTARPDSSRIWWLPVVMVLWANADPRAWVGMVFVALFIVASSLSGGVGRKTLLAGIAGIALGVLISPWPIQPAFGFRNAVAYMLETQTQGASESLFPRYAFGMKDPNFWLAIDPFLIAQSALLVLSFVAVFLNAGRMHWGWIAGWLGMNGLAAFLGPLVPYAAIVNCVVASLQGQDWYRNASKMEYRVAAWPVFASRAGRAVTVLCFFALAYGAINGGLFGVNARRIGIGLDPRVANRIESTREKLVPGVFEDRVFNVRADQGDLMIWLGVKPFIDSRHALFVDAEQNYARLHRDIRDSLFPSTADTEAGQESGVDWSEEFVKWKIDSVNLRLWGDAPAYQVFAQMFVNQRWIMTGLGAAGAVFSRADRDDAMLIEHVEEHNRTNFFSAAFQENQTTVAKLQERYPTWPSPPSDYDRWLIQKMNVQPNAIQLARHYFVLASTLRQAVDVRVIGALGELSLQSAAQGIQESPNSALGYRLIRDSQMLMSDVEQQLMQATGNVQALPMRRQLALFAAFHAAIASGDVPEDLLSLFSQLTAVGDLDTASQIAQRFTRKTGRSIAAAQTDDPEQIKQGNLALDELDGRIAEVSEEVETARGNDATILEMAQIALNGNCPTLAIQILEEDRTLMARDPTLQINYASLLLRVGRTFEAWEQLEQLEPTIQQIPQQENPIIARWREMNGFANLAALNPIRAIEMWTAQADSLNQSSVRGLLTIPPLASNPSGFLDIWPALSTRLAMAALVEFPERWSALMLQKAQAELDSGLVDEATEDLKQILEVHPEYSLRSLVVIMLAVLTGEDYGLRPPSDEIPVWDGMFSDEDPADENAASEESESQEVAPETPAPQTPDESAPASEPEKQPSESSTPPESEAEATDGSDEEGTADATNPPSPELPSPIDD
ncbi:hypothetical protein AB1L42_06825 [Thalassoglobus sp. JC818]|uniref:hypothetical protein n=1 Tax=Thalassoglobus sp. JC818 TaxID=3232136 RepID=UPI0034584458